MSESTSNSVVKSVYTLLTSPTFAEMISESNNPETGPMMICRTFCNVHRALLKAGKQSELPGLYDRIVEAVGTPADYELEG